MVNGPLQVNIVERDIMYLKGFQPRGKDPFGLVTEINGKEHAWDNGSWTSSGPATSYRTINVAKRTIRKNGWKLKDIVKALRLF